MEEQDIQKVSDDCCNKKYDEFQRYKDEVLLKLFNGKRYNKI